MPNLEEVTGFACLQAGDRVLLSVDGTFTADSAAEVKGLLAERFPGVEFTFVNATSALVMRDS